MRIYQFSQKSPYNFLCQFVNILQNSLQSSAEFSAEFYFIVHLGFVSDPSFWIKLFFLKYVKVVLTLLFITSMSSANCGYTKSFISCLLLPSLFLIKFNIIFLNSSDDKYSILLSTTLFIGIFTLKTSSSLNSGTPPLYIRVYFTIFLIPEPNSSANPISLKKFAILN